MRKRIVGIVAALGIGAAAFQGVTATVASAVPSCSGRFEIVYKYEDWSGARDLALRMGGHLATINNQTEQRCIERLMMGGMVAGGRGAGFHRLGGGSFWIGGTDERNEGVWRWVDPAGRGRMQVFYKQGSTARRPFTMWAPGEPNNDPGKGGYENCLEIYSVYRDLSRNVGLGEGPSRPGRAMWNDSYCGIDRPFIVEY